MKNIFISFLVFIIVLASVTATKAEDFGIKFNGFVKTDVIFDTRQTEAPREGHFLLYPKSENLDPDGNDLNGKQNFNILSIQSRLIGNISAPDVLGAKTSGVIEGAFFGAAAGLENTFRLRRALIQLDWDNTQLKFGQDWHPMFVTNCFPGVVSFNTGAPFQPFSRNPQIQLTQTMGAIKLELAAVTQRDFASTGPDPEDYSAKQKTNSIFQRNAGIPEVDFGVHFNTTNLQFGAVGGYKMLLPKLHVLNNEKQPVQTDEMIGSIQALAYAKLIAGGLTIKAEGAYGGNMSNFLMLGGYTTKSIDSLSGMEEYTNINTMSAWTDISYGDDLQFGVFAGYTKNMGTDDNYIGEFYGRENNTLESILRVSPRVILNWEKLRFAGEIEYTSAAFGPADINDKGSFDETTAVSNIRALFAVYLFF